MPFVIAGIYSVGVALSEHIYLSFFLPVLLHIALNYKALFSALKKLLALNIFVLLSVVSVLIAKNYELAGIIFLRANLIMLFCILSFSGVLSISQSFCNLGFGDKITSLAYFCEYFIKLFLKDLAGFKITLKARGLRHKTSIFTIKAYGAMIGVLFITANKRLEELSTTLLARGFKGKVLSKKPLKISTKELILLFCVIICAIFKIKEIL